MSLQSNLNKQISRTRLKLTNQLKNTILNNAVAKKVINKELDVIEANVYEAYQPSVYLRREADGGLKDSRNFTTRITGDSRNIQMYVMNTTKANPETTNGTSINANQFLLPIIEQGSPYDFPDKNKAYSQPRDVRHSTVEALQSTKQISATIKKELIAKGWKVE